LRQTLQAFFQLFTVNSFRELLGDDRAPRLSLVFVIRKPIGGIASIANTKPIGTTENVGAKCYLFVIENLVVVLVIPKRLKRTPFNVGILANKKAYAGAEVVNLLAVRGRILVGAKPFDGSPPFKTGEFDEQSDNTCHRRSSAKRGDS